MKHEIKAGDECWLELNDHFGTRQQVTVIRVYKGGNALVHDGAVERQCAVADLRKLDKREMGGAR